MRNIFLKLVFGAVAIGIATLANAQWKPRGNIELIVSAGAGGGNDKTARLLAKVLQDHKLVPVPVLVINKPGAGGVIAQNYLNSHAGEGNYVMITNPAIITNSITGTGSVSYTGVTPVAQLFTEYVVLIVRSASDLKTGKDAIDRLKKDPGSLTLGVAPAVGAGTHIGIAIAAKAAGINPSNMRIIPYATSGDVMTALIGGHIDMMASVPINVLPQLESGTVRALAITGAKRLPGKFAQVPTFRESGADAEFGNWRGLVGPRGMTAEQVSFWESVLSKLVATPEWQEEVREQLSDNTYLGPVDSKAFLDRENVRLSRLLAELGLSKK